MEESPDMPVFTLLGQDSLAVDTVKYWLQRAELLGVNKGKLIRVREHLEALAKYRQEHPEKMKRPD